MAYLHKDSKQATIPELEIFQVPDTQTAVEHMYKLDVRPMTSVSESSVVEFVFGGENSDYLCLKGSRLAIKMQLLHEDGTKLHLQEKTMAGVVKTGSAVDEKAVPVNLALHSMWSQIDVFINGQRMTQASNMQPYKAYIKTLMRNGTEAKKTQLAAQGYQQETGANLDDLDSDNKGYVWRQKMFKGSKTVEFEGPLLEDIMELDKYLLNGMRVQIKLYPSLKKFFVMASDTSKEYKVKLIDIVLRACMIKVSPGVILGHAKAMESQNAVYPYTRVETKSYAIGSATRNVYLDNLYQGNRPSRLVLGFVASQAFNGAYDRNPFKFHHYNVTDIRLVVDGQTVPGRPLKVDFDLLTGSNYIEAYVNMFESLGVAGKDFGAGLTPELYAQGHTLFVYNLEPMPLNQPYINLKRHANVRLEINFEFPLTETITAVLYSEYTGVFEVDSARNVIMPSTN
jgi:hypothetical protein